MINKCKHINKDEHFVHCLFCRRKYLANNSDSHHVEVFCSFKCEEMYDTFEKDCKYTQSIDGTFIPRNLCLYIN